MRTSRALASSLLGDFRFAQHVFAVRSVEQLQESLGLLITRMDTSSSFNGSLMGYDGRSLLPRSLVALMLGANYLSFAWPPSSVDVYRNSEKSRVWGYGEVDWDSDLKELMATWVAERPFAYVGYFNRPIPLGCLPDGLRVLSLSHSFNQPIQPGSLPSTVQYIQFGRQFDQKLEEELFPDSVSRISLYWETDEGERYGARTPEMQRAVLKGKTLYLYRRQPTVPSDAGPFSGSDFGR
jgi:hypothetical protein